MGQREYNVINELYNIIILQLFILKIKKCINDFESLYFVLSYFQ